MQNNLPLTQFGSYQQNRGKAPAEMYLFNSNYKSVTVTHANLGIKWVERLHSTVIKEFFLSLIPLFTNSQII